MVPVLPPLDAPQEDATARPRGQLRIGALRLTPGFALRDLGVDTNVYNTRTDRKQDFTFTAGPQGRAQLELGRFRLTGTGDVGYVYYQKFDSERSFNRSIAGLAEARLARRLLVYASDAFRNTRERLNFEVDARARRIEKEVQAGALVGLSRKITAQLSGALGERRFADNAAIGGVRLDRTMNVDTRSVAARVAYVATPLTTLFMTGNASESRFTESPERNADETNFSFGGAFKPRALVAGTASVGYQRALMLNLPMLSYAGLIADLGVRYRPRDATEFGLTATRGRQASFEANHPYSITTGVGGSIRQHLFRSVDLYLEATREARTYAQLPSFPDSIWAGTDVGGRYRATIGVNSARRIRLDVTLEYTRRGAERVFAREFDGLRVGASFSVGRFSIRNRQGGAGGQQ